MGVELGIPYLAELSYVAIPLVLLLGSIGILPVPEEVILLVIGYAAFAKLFSLPIAMLVAIASVIFVDNLHFYLSSQGHWLLRRFLNGKMLERVQYAIDQHGSLSVWIARFIPGMRILTPWVAGTSGMRWRKFALANALGAAIQTPIMVWIGFALGPHVENVIAVAQSVDAAIPLILLIVFVLAAILICIYHKSIRHLLLARGGANGRV